MKISIRVKPNARKNSVEQLDDGSYLVRVNAPAVEGKANEKLIELLAEYFHTARRNISIVKGETSKTKVMEIAGIETQFI